MNSSPPPPPELPTLEDLIESLRSQPGYQSMTAAISPEERASIENDVKRMMERYYTHVLKPLVSE